MPLHRAVRLALTAVLAAGVLTTALPGRTSQAAVLPSGFQEQIVFSGLTQPTNMEFAPDGRVFVTEKAGLIKVFDNLADTTPTIFANLTTNVHNTWDRGLLGLALAPTFPADPSVYVLYTYDAPPGGTAPVYNDGNCGSSNNWQCLVSGRLSRLTANGNVMTGAEQVLIKDEWCQQFPSHSIGDLNFGQDGMLYVSAGDGASFNAVDYGQLGDPVNPCGDPVDEGGALRAQDVRATGDPTGLDGAILRLDPATGDAAAGNPTTTGDMNARRIVAHGLRNPYRFTIRPGTNEVWLGDVGWNTWEEVNRIATPTAAVRNFGWPCYENTGKTSYDAYNKPLCESLYADPVGQSAPYVAWNHGSTLVPGEACPSGNSAVAGLAFYPTSGGAYPSAYQGALFFADYSRHCIWAMKPDTAGGLPSKSKIETFASSASTPVDLEIGPGGELYYVDLEGGTIRRFRYFPGNQPPIADIQATPTSGGTPLTVSFSATSSTDADPADAGRLKYAWDFTNDGIVDSRAATASVTYSSAGVYQAKLTVTDTLGASGTASIAISSGNSAPIAVIGSPEIGTTWKVGDTITFAGHARDPQQGNLPDSALTWHLRMQHCYAPGNCHAHVIEDFVGVSSGSFVAPDHEYPSYLELELVATDAQGLTSSYLRRLNPRTVDLTFTSNPPGRQLSVGAVTQTAPFTVTLIQGSTTTISAPSPQQSGLTTYTFGGWSDGKARSHSITANSDATYTATFSSTTALCADSYGYNCSTVEAQPYLSADTQLAVQGDDGGAVLTLPFAFPFYDTTHTSVWADVNGLVSFTPYPPSPGQNVSIPTTTSPNAAIYAFWDNLVVDASASMRTATLGRAPDRQFVIEWRNVALASDPASRINAEVVLHEDGSIVLNYDLLDNVAERGQSATVGIENPAGQVGLRYSYNQPVLANRTAVVFTPPTSTRGTLTGTVTVAGVPVAGATVSLLPAGLTTTTAADGTFTFTSVLVGSYTLRATTSGDGCGAVAQVPVVVTADVTTTLTLTAHERCTAGPTPS